MKKITLLLLLFVFSCTYTNTYTNREKDKEDAEVVSNKFYSYLKQNNYKATFTLLTEDLLKPSSKKELINVYENTKRYLGELKETTLLNWATKSVEGGKEYADYAFQYKNIYDSGISVEYIRLYKDSKKQIKIVEYKVNSTKLLK